MQSLKSVGRTDSHSSNVLEFRADLQGTKGLINISSSYTRIDKTLYEESIKTNNKSAYVVNEKVENRSETKKSIMN